ncbi:MAG: leucine-rich repeat protein [Alphaproteobacteria bacterium]|nr:leucine-rich repeat protein [Alphaproteobacteria bacterium]
MKKLIFVLVLSSFAVAAQESESLTCGDDCHWNYDETTKTLTITGSGAMKDFGPDGAVGNNKLTYQAERPWNDIASEVENLVVSGVTSIGHRAFQDMHNLQNVTIADSVTSVGRSSFAQSGYGNMQDIIIPNSTVEFKGDSFGSFNSTMYCSEQNRSICEEALRHSSKTDEQIASMLQTYQIDGGKYVFDGKKYKSLLDYYNGKEYDLKRIYTVEEAAKVSKKTGNTFKLRYK